MSTPYPPARCVKLAYLMRSPSRDEDGIPKTLHNGVAMHSILLQQAIPKLFIQIPALVMDGVMVLLNGLATLPGHLNKTIDVM